MDDRFSEGEFIYHESKGFGFLLRRHKNKFGWKAWHPTSAVNPRDNSISMMCRAGREPTDAELAAFVAWRLQNGI
jgi:hypothetical protein